MITEGVVLIFAVGILGGLLSAMAVRKMSIPQVLGYIITGIILGESGFKFITNGDIEKLSPFNFVALGIIGFLVGGELKFSTMKKYGKQFSAILLAEGIFAFLLVGISSGLIIFFIVHSVSAALAAGIVFGAIASATDPASTISVLWEYRTAGILTTTVIAIVALDDALAMTLYGLGTSIAQIIAGGNSDILSALLSIFKELFGSIFLGATAGFLISIFVRKSTQKSHITTAVIGLLFLLVAISVAFDLDVILASMAAGIALVNIVPKRSEELLEHIKSFSDPIYILFFVLVGARLSIGHMPSWLWLIIISYVVFRSLGKMGGAYLGAVISKAEPEVRKFTGLSLFAQGGVAIGLSIMASQHLGNILVKDGLYLGDVIIFAVTATTFIVQIIGPTSVKLAVKLAGEIGKNITKEDIIKEFSVKDILTTDIKTVTENATLKVVYDVFVSSDISIIPVLTDESKLVGLITMKSLKEGMLDQSSWEWVLATDILQEVKEVIDMNTPLQDALIEMDRLQYECIPVLSDGIYKGIISKVHVNNFITNEIIKRHGSKN